MSSERHNRAPGVTGSSGIDVYVSHPFVHRRAQRDFIECLQSDLAARGFAPATVAAIGGVRTSPLAAIRSRIVESYGLVVVAFRKMWVERGMIRGDSEDPALPAAAVARSWLTSPYCQIEPAMAYQLSLPILVLRENGIRPEGFLDDAADVLSAPEIDLREDPRRYFRSELWTRTVGEWDTLVRWRFRSEQREFRPALKWQALL